MTGALGANSAATRKGCRTGAKPGNGRGFRPRFLLCEAKREILAARWGLVATLALPGRRPPRRHYAQSARARGRCRALGRNTRGAVDDSGLKFRPLRPDNSPRGLLPAPP